MLASEKTQPALTAYRPDIDGLRAIAILLVVVFHAFPEFLPGGFVGVDVFFVISGYLISTIILNKLTTTDFSFIWFYRNRIKRLFPALLTVLLCCWLLALLLLFAKEFVNFSKHLAGSLGFIENFVLYSETGYFDDDAILKPLMHIWSLGIEEQFYLFYPLLLYMLWRCGINFFITVVLLTALSFTCNLFALHHNPSGAFFLPQNRAWEPFLGCIGAYIHYFYNTMRPAGTANPQNAHLAHKILATAFVRKITSTPTARQLTAIAGLLFISISVCLATPQVVCLAVLGTFLIILAGPQAKLNRLCIGHKILVGIGLISYPLYLWHWPLLSFAHIIKGDELANHITLFIVLLSFVLAFLTYKLVERPLRFRSTRIKFAGLIIAALLLAGISFLSFTQKIKPYSAVTGVEKIVAEANANMILGFSEGFTLAQNYGQIPVYEIAGEQKTLFMGNSFVAQYAPRISRVLAQTGNERRGALLVYTGTCLPIPGFEYENLPCSELLHAFNETIKDPSIDSVVVSANWFHYLYSSPHGCRVLARIDDKPMCTKPGFAAAMRNLELFLQQVRATGKNIYIVSSTPFGPKFKINSIVRRSLWPLGVNVDFSASYRSSEVREQFAEGIEALSNMASRNGFYFIDPLKYMCPKGNCGAFDPKGELIYAKDGRHIRTAYVRKYIRFLDKAILGQAN